ncbi:SDR family NAD(P)-dependent oxidoreductase [Streptosporangium sp. LJ11]|uniref:SDR family NAD(P)-dependent oxidoreductase n=1 Tax=Streptosporangium sp. LJ11 TaxID=3436927 RepID=UPI003F7B2D26
MVVTSREATPRPRAGSRRPNAGVYAATKFGITAFSGSLRQEVTTQGLRVVIIEPGFVATELASHITHPAIGDMAREMVVSMRTLRPEDIRPCGRLRDHPAEPRRGQRDPRPPNGSDTADTRRPARPPGGAGVVGARMISVFRHTPGVLSAAREHDHNEQSRSRCSSSARSTSAQACAKPASRSGPSTSTNRA